MSAASRLRIVHIDASLDLRGGQRQLLLLARRLAQRGHSQTIVCPEDSALEVQASKEGFANLTLPSHDPGHAYGIVQLRQRLALKPCGVLHAHDGKGQTISWLASLGKPVLRIASRRVIFAPAQPIWTRLKYGYTCHAVIAVSGFVKQMLESAGVPGGRIEVIPDGIELPSELPRPEIRRQTRAGWKISEDDVAVGFMGWPTREKGLDIAVNAFAVLEKRMPRAHLLVAADPPAEGAARITTSHRAIHWLGFQENLAAYFGGLDLFIMPSRSEGLGSAALLAMAHGVPVVATRVGGLPEVVSEGKTGWIVEPESPEAMAEAVIAAMSNAARLREFGANGRERAQQFSADAMAERTESLYRRLLCSS